MEIKKKHKVDIDNFRRTHLSMAEMVDAWRVFPRIFVLGYGYLVWDVVQWFKELPDPTTQHAALLTTMIGAAALIMNFYVQTGRKWNGFTSWKHTTTYTTENKDTNDSA